MPPSLVVVWREKLFASLLVIRLHAGGVAGLAGLVSLGSTCRRLYADILAEVYVLFSDSLTAAPLRYMPTVQLDSCNYANYFESLQRRACDGQYRGLVRDCDPANPANARALKEGTVSFCCGLEAVGCTLVERVIYQGSEVDTSTGDSCVIAHPFDERDRIAIGMVARVRDSPTSDRLIVAVSAKTVGLRVVVCGHGVEWVSIDSLVRVCATTRVQQLFVGARQLSRWLSKCQHDLFCGGFDLQDSEDQWGRDDDVHLFRSGDVTPVSSMSSLPGSVTSCQETAGDTYFHDLVVFDEERQSPLGSLRVGGLPRGSGVSTGCAGSSACGSPSVRRGDSSVVCGTSTRVSDSCSHSGFVSGPVAVRRPRLRPRLGGGASAVSGGGTGRECVSRAELRARRRPCLDTDSDSSASDGACRGAGADVQRHSQLRSCGRVCSDSPSVVDRGRRAHSKTEGGRRPLLRGDSASDSDVDRNGAGGGSGLCIGGGARGALGPCIDRCMDSDSVGATGLRLRPRRAVGERRWPRLDSDSDSSASGGAGRGARTCLPRQRRPRYDMHREGPSPAGSFTRRAVRLDSDSVSGSDSDSVRASGCLRRRSRTRAGGGVVRGSSDDVDRDGSPESVPRGLGVVIDDVCARLAAGSQSPPCRALLAVLCDRHGRQLVVGRSGEGVSSGTAGLVRGGGRPTVLVRAAATDVGVHRARPRQPGVRYLALRDIVSSGSESDEAGRWGGTGPSGLGVGSSRSVQGAPYPGLVRRRSAASLRRTRRCVETSQPPVVLHAGDDFADWSPRWLRSALVRRRLPSDGDVSELLLRLRFELVRVEGLLGLPCVHPDPGIACVECAAAGIPPVVGFFYHDGVKYRVSYEDHVERQSHELEALIGADLLDDAATALENFRGCAGCTVEESARLGELLRRASEHRVAIQISMY